MEVKIFVLHGNVWFVRRGNMRFRNYHEEIWRLLGKERGVQSSEGYLFPGKKVLGLVWRHRPTEAVRWTHTIGSSSWVGAFNHDVQVVFRHSYISQCTLWVKTWKFAELRQMPDSLLLLQVHIELLISIKFMGVLARGTVRLVDVYTIGGNVVSWWVRVRSREIENEEERAVLMQQKRSTVKYHGLPSLA